MAKRDDRRRIAGGEPKIKLPLQQLRKIGRRPARTIVPDLERPDAERILAIDVGERDLGQIVKLGRHFGEGNAVHERAGQEALQKDHGVGFEGGELHRVGGPLRVIPVSRRQRHAVHGHAQFGQALGRRDREVGLAGGAVGSNGGELRAGEGAGVSGDLVHVALIRLRPIVAAAPADGDAGAEGRVKVLVRRNGRIIGGDANAVHVEAQRVGGDGDGVGPATDDNVGERFVENCRDMPPPAVGSPTGHDGAVSGQHVRASAANLRVGDVEVEFVAGEVRRWLQSQPVGITLAAAVEGRGVAPKEYLLGGTNLLMTRARRVGRQRRVDPAFDRKRVGESELRRVSQFDLVGGVVNVFIGEDIGISIQARERPVETEHLGADKPRLDVGSAKEERAVVAADEVLGALAQGIDAAIPPADSARAAEVVAQLVTVARGGREETLHRARGHRQPIGGGHVKERVADHRDGPVGDGPVPGADGGAVGNARNGRADIIQARQGAAEAVRENEHGREVRGDVGSRGELDRERRQIGVLSEMQQTVNRVGHHGYEDKVIDHRVQVVGRVGISRAVGIQSPDNDGCRVGGGGKGNGVRFPPRPGVGPGDPIGERIGLISRGGEQRHFGRDGADEHIGAVFAAGAHAEDGVNLAGREGALIDAELIQAAGESGAEGKPGRMEPEIEVARGARHEAGGEMDGGCALAVGVEDRVAAVRAVGKRDMLPAVVGDGVGNGGDDMGLEIGVPEVSPEGALGEIGAGQTREPELDPLRGRIGGVVPFHQRGRSDQRSESRLDPGVGGVPNQVAVRADREVHRASR